jgi:hypothetical protein
MSKKNKPVVEEDDIFQSFKDVIDGVSIEDLQEEIPEDTPEVKEEALIPQMRLHKAHNVFYNKEKRKYMLVTIDYSPDTDYTKIVSTEELTDNLAVAISKVSNIFSLKLFKNEEDV